MRTKLCREEKVNEQTDKKADTAETEEKANEYMKKAVEEFKKQNVVEDDRNYLVIKNEKVKWN